MTQGINEQVGLVAAIEAERHFLAVRLEVLRADAMPRANDAALQKRERGFNCVGVDVALRVDAEFVPDGLVPSVFADMLCRALVSAPIIGVQDVHVFADILADVFGERARLGIVTVEKPEIAVALTDADDHFLVIVLCDVALAAHLAADIGCVHFDFAIQHRLIGLRHRVPDSVAEIPCRLVADSDGALYLAGAHTLLCFAEQIGCCKPLLKRKMSVIENRAGQGGELIAA